MNKLKKIHKDVDEMLIDTCQSLPMKLTVFFNLLERILYALSNKSLNMHTKWKDFTIKGEYEVDKNRVRPVLQFKVFDERLC